MLAGEEPARLPAAERLNRELEALDCESLLIVARSADSPDLARYARGVHLGASYVLATRNDGVHLAFATAMEREEAARTGLALLTPEDLGYAELRQDGLTGGELWAEWIGRGLEQVGVEPGPLALAGEIRSGDLWQCCSRLSREGWRFRSATEAMLRVRKSKSDWELTEIRRSALGTVEAFHRVAGLLSASREGPSGQLELAGEALTIGRLRAEVRMLFAEKGLEQPHGNLLAPAKEGAVPHNTGTDERPLAVGETLVVDLFPKGHLFADCTRTFCVGEPTPQARVAYDAVRSALELAWRKTTAGANAWAAQEAVCEHFRERGYQTPLDDSELVEGYVHGLGHGVGYDLHEYPSYSCRAGDEGTIEVGDVLTLEPGLYSPSQGYGIRLEDLVWISEDGPRNLTPLPYDLDPRAWSL